MYQQRLATVRGMLTAWGVDGVLISSPTNRRWLSGFTGSNGQLLITHDCALLATDFRYYEQVARQSPHFTLFKHERTQAETAVFIQTANVSTIGVEAAHTTLETMADLKTATSASDSGRRSVQAVSHINWIPLKTTVEPLRCIKSPAEIKAIHAAAAITDLAMAQVNQLARPGITERQLAWQLEMTMREAGADGMAFSVIVASGPNSALPHYATGERPLQPNDPIIIDMGAMLNGYRSDMTRSFFLGSEPTEQFWDVYNLVLEAQTAVIQTAKPGMSNKSVDAIARDIISNGGHSDHFGHGLGHGVGLDIHEEPFLSTRSTDDEFLTIGMTVTVEPGIYIPGWGGVRIEDLCVVGETGLERLSHCPKIPIIPLGK